jgi:hypothetical protein
MDNPSALVDFMQPVLHELERAGQVVYSTGSNIP